MDDWLEEIEARAEKATPGPWWQKSWKQQTGEGTELSDLLCYFEDEGQPRFWDWENTGEFVAHARADIPRLIREVKAQRAALAKVLTENRANAEEVERLRTVLTLVKAYADSHAELNDPAEHRFTLGQISATIEDALKREE